MNLSRSNGTLTDLARGASVGVTRESSRARCAEANPADLLETPDIGHLGTWRADLRRAVVDVVTEFVAARCTDVLEPSGIDVAGEILLEFVGGGKCLRSAFMYLGWLCGAPASDAAVSATASLELLHAFALLQDDVMDGSASRRGRPAAHIQFADWHRRRGLSGSSRRFGESAAILLGDLCLVWAERMLRDSGLPSHCLQRAWPRYDAMRTELAVGQFADVASDVRDMPTMESVMTVARLKSGNYTVRRPLEIGAAMADCGERLLARLGEYGSAVGEAFQLRDDVLGIFGSPAVTGKPSGGDLIERKATSVVVAARQFADATTRRQLLELETSDRIDESALDHWRNLILATGAVQWIEQLITDRVAAAEKALDGSGIGDPVTTALVDMAGLCAGRAA
jgi:geranylgeranyl diphosphate synthase, type I